MTERKTYLDNIIRMNRHRVKIEKISNFNPILLI